MKTSKVIFLASISFLIKIIGTVMMIVIIFLAYSLLEGIEQGDIILTFGDVLKLIISAIFLFWVSLRLMIFGDELSKKYK